MFFLSDANTASFSDLKKYIKNEFQNPQSQQTVNAPSFNPIGTVKRKVGQAGTLAGLGTAKYIRDNKLNRRQRKQVDKWANLFNPKPKKQWFPNPFRKKQPLPPTQTGVTK